jgi:MoaA/NifB/PqqE/SkfB family radical SAM enzyme
MAGAIAGTAILHLNGASDQLQVVTLTVNNICNLRCDHCYLQYGRANANVAERIVDALCEADFRHLAIVGKEPLANRVAAEECQALILRFLAASKSVSIITNGHGLHYLHPEILESLAWIDVSFDGGPQSYATYRKAPFAKLIENLRWLERSGFDRVNAMFAISKQNIANIDDMMKVQLEFAFDRLVFSPYVVTLNHGVNFVEPASLKAVCDAFANSKPFMESSKSIFLLGTEAFPDLEPTLLEEEAEASGILNKTRLVKCDPLGLGILRVTYDGLVLTPYESLHTANYRSIGRPLLDGQQLNQIYHDLRFVACA